MRESICTIIFTDMTDAADTAEDTQEEAADACAQAEPSPPPCSCPCPLEDRVTRLEERLDGVIESHHLWDGS